MNLYGKGEAPGMTLVVRPYVAPEGGCPYS